MSPMNKTTPSNNLDLNLLRVFVTVYQERNLKRAAQRLSLTAPSVSVKLTKFKDRIGGELFFKTATGLEPTELAQRLFERVEPLLSELHGAVDFLEGFDPARLTEPVILDIGQNVIPWLTPSLHEALMKSCPQSHLIANHFTGSSLDRIRKGQVSIGVQHPIEDLPKDILEVPLASLEMGAIVRKDHPFIGDQAKVEDLLPYGLATFEQSFTGLGRGGAFLRLLQRDNVPMEVKFRSPSVYAVCEILKRSDLILPTCLNLVRYSGEELRAIRVTDYPQMTRMQVNAYLHQKNRHSEKHLWLLELLKREIQYSA